MSVMSTFSVSLCYFYCVCFCVFFFNCRVKFTLFFSLYLGNWPCCKQTCLTDTVFPQDFWRQGWKDSDPPRWSASGSEKKNYLGKMTSQRASKQRLRLSKTLNQKNLWPLTSVWTSGRTPLCSQLKAWVGLWGARGGSFCFLWLKMRPDGSQLIVNLIFEMFLEVCLFDFFFFFAFTVQRQQTAARLEELQVWGDVTLCFKTCACMMLLMHLG